METSTTSIQPWESILPNTNEFSASEFNKCIVQDTISEIPTSPTKNFPAVAQLSFIPVEENMVFRNLKHN